MTKIKIRKVILKNRPDLERQLLFNDSKIYESVVSKAEEMNIVFDTEENIQKIWTALNLENPIPNLTAELDLVFEEEYSEVKNKLLEDGIYQRTLIQIGESEDCQKTFEKHNYFDISAFSYTTNFEEEMRTVVKNYVKTISNN